MNKQIIPIIIIAILAASIGAYFVLQKPTPPKPSQEITSFEECAKAGYPILETYPRQCKTPDGRTFTDDVIAGSRCGDKICDKKEQANPQLCPIDCEEQKTKQPPTTKPPVTQPPATPVPPPATQLNINGVYSTGLEKAGTETLNSILANHYVDGFSLRTGWKDIEPTEGNYNWQVFDTLIEKAKTANKKIMLRVLAGGLSPEWVYSAGVKKFEYIDQNPYHATYGQTLYMPLPWDEIYLQKWTNFIKKFGEKYNNEPLVAIIQTAGPAVGGEMHLVDKDDEVKWLSYGYSEEKLVNAWKITIDAYDSAFANKQIAMCIAQPVKFGNPQQIVEDIVAYGYQKLGTRYSIQGNFLAAKISDDFSAYVLIKSYSSKTTVGFQMLWSYTQDNGKRLGGSLRDSIQRGLDAGAKYLEIYLSDIMNSGLSEDIKYAHEELNK